MTWLRDNNTHLNKDPQPVSGSRQEPVVMLPLPEGIPRMESTPIQFGDDWPGCFIRGDHCFQLAMSIDEASEALMKTNPINAVLLKSYSEFLKSCKAT